jgi:hypothetical protein
MQMTIAPTPKNGSVQKSPVITDQPVNMVYITTKYDQFKILNDNREVNPVHVRRLVDSFNEMHLVCPIIVNEKMEVIDGQHRLQASIETGRPIFYIQVPGYGIKEVQRLNANQKNWTKADFLEMYCSQGKKPYLEFRAFMNEFPELSFQAVERILSGLASAGGKQTTIAGKKVSMNDFQEGKLIIPNPGLSLKNARKIMEFKDFYDGFSRGTFVSAVLPLFKSKNYDHREMIYKLGVAPIKLTHCQNVSQYRLLLENIYNWKRQKDNKVSFRYEY